MGCWLDHSSHTHHLDKLEVPITSVKNSFRFLTSNCCWHRFGSYAEKNLFALQKEKSINTSLDRFATLNMWSLSSLVYQLSFSKWHLMGWMGKGTKRNASWVNAGVQPHPWSWGQVGASWIICTDQTTRTWGAERGTHRWMDESLNAWSIARWMGDGGGEERVLMAVCGPGYITTGQKAGYEGGEQNEAAEMQSKVTVHWKMTRSVLLSFTFSNKIWKANRTGRVFYACGLKCIVKDYWWYG